MASLMDGEDNSSNDILNVKAVCSEFRAIEDAALAQQLQDEEFQNHYIRNRKDRGTAREDVRAAKNAYLEEVREAGILTGSEFKTLSKDKVWLFSELDRRVAEEAELEKQHKQAMELQDEEYARYLQERERLKIEEERRRRLEMRFRENPRNAVNTEQQEKIITKDQKPPAPSRETFDDQRKFEKEGVVKQMIPSPEEEERHATSSKGTRNRSECITRNGAPNESKERTWNGDIRSWDVDEDELDVQRRKQEEKDEQLARRIQLEEEKRQKRMIEDRDRRLAIKIQQKEAEGYRRRKAEREIRRAASLPASELQGSRVDGGNTGFEKTKIAEEGDNEHEIRRAASISNPRNHVSSNPARSNPWEKQQWHGGEEVCTRGPRDIDLPEQHSVRNESLLHLSLNAERVELPKETSQTFDRLTHVSNLKGFDVSTSDSNVGERNDKNSWNETENSHESPRHFENVAATIDPTYRRSSATKNNDQASVNGQDSVDVDNNAGSPSTPTRPVPVIQNVRRKKSFEDKKKRKNSEKCKQQ